MSRAIEETIQPTRFQQIGRALGLVAAWAWTILAGIGGLGLMIARGPWPLTNGWFAFFSGVAACPLTGWLVQKYTTTRPSGWLRFMVAFLIIILGRLVLKMEGRGNFLPGAPQ